MSHNTGDCNRQPVPKKRPADRFHILSHNPKGIRDSLLNTNIHLDSSTEAEAVCEMLNTMYEVANTLVELGKLILKQESTINKLDNVIAKQDITITHLKNIGNAIDVKEEENLHG